VLLAVTACGGRSGSGGDGAGEAGSSGAPPACVADATVAAPASPVSGSVIGARLRAALCSGGANAYVEVTPTSQTVLSQTVLILSPATSGDPQTRFDVQVPKQAVQGDLSGLLGMTGPAPGTYPSESSCGSVTVCVTLPLPADLVCASAGACPPGCALQGPVLGPICQPITPTLCYQAQAARYCALGTAVPRGSWSLALTSLDPYAPDSGASLERFVAHGTLTAEVWNTDGSADSAQLSIVF
jgi:hypothetical protein